MKYENLDQKIKNKLVQYERSVGNGEITFYGLIGTKDFVQCTDCGKLFHGHIEGEEHVRRDHYVDMRNNALSNCTVYGKAPSVIESSYVSYDKNPLIKTTEDLKDCDLYEVIMAFGFKWLNEDEIKKPKEIQGETTEVWNMQLNVGKDKLGEKIDEMLCVGIPVSDIRVEKNKHGNFVLRVVVREEE